MDPRRLAFEILCDLEKTPTRLESLLNRKLAKHVKAQARDKGLTTTLVYGVLRNRSYLDYLLAPFLRKPVKELDLPVITILRMAACELVFLEKPSFASVNSAVELAKKGPAKRAQGLINACLRAFAKSWQKTDLPNRETDFRDWLCIKHSHPKWVVDELIHHFGKDEAQKWCAANQFQPIPTIRVNSLKTDAESLSKELAQEVRNITPHLLSEDVLQLQGFSGQLMNLYGFEQGLWQAQDPAACLLTKLVNAKPGMRVLDLCAGAGGKTGYLAAMMENQKGLVACDPSAGRIKALKGNLARLGVKNVKIRKMKAQDIDPEFGLFDRILIDAPCSGLGVIGRRPDVRWRRTPQDSKELSKVQRQLLEKASQLLAPKGEIIYATCTMISQENEQVVQGFLKANKNFELIPFTEKEVLPSLIGENGEFRTLPHVHQSDAFFAVRIKAFE